MRCVYSLNHGCSPQACACLRVRRTIRMFMSSMGVDASRVCPVLLCSEKQKLIDSMIAIDRGVSRRQLNGITRRVQRFYRDRRNRLLMKETLQRAGLDYNLLSGEYSNWLLAGASTVFGLEEDVAILLIQAALRGFLARGVCKRLRFVRTGVQFVALLVEYETALDSLHYDPTQNVSSHP